MITNRLNSINPKKEIKLTYELWLEDWKKRYCKECLISVPAPQNCYICFQERKIGFSCVRCSRFIYCSEAQICAGFYEVGSCFCERFQEVIKKHLGNKNCFCEFTLAGYSAGHPVHNYRLTINGIVKSFFKGSKLWVKLICRSCEKVIQSFKLGCDCHLEQKKHQHLYSKDRCLNCAINNCVRPLSEEDLQNKYQQYCQIWQEQEEIHARQLIKKQYKYDGMNYWAKCSFCKREIKGQKSHQEPLSRNKVSFWTGNEADERIICGRCLRDKKLVKELKIKGVKRQMLYNYRKKQLI